MKPAIYVRKLSEEEVHTLKEGLRSPVAVHSSIRLLLGGTSPKVPAYAGGLDYHLSMDEYCEFFAAAAGLGFKAFKIKVGHPDLQWELARLKADRIA
jgi:L-alanine-DL-glutamate epimerase-like enolase superfamily enzyme